MSTASAERLPGGAALVALESVDSTNAEAARRAEAGEAAPLWIMARRQTAGRGRRGRPWTAPEGNLSASLLLRPGTDAETAALYSFVACLAVAELFGALAPDAEIGLKWPNDTLLNGRKAAGVLLESSGRDGRLDWLVVGIGVNLREAPRIGDIRPGGALPTSIVAEGGRAVAPGEALAILAGAFARWQAVFETGGFAPIRAAWLSRAARLGKTIGAGLAHEAVEGIFEDVDENGALVLRTAGGALRHIAAADIYFPE